MTAPPSLESDQIDSAQITAASGSNLALSFASLPPAKRRAMSIFYAFCRVIDDIADSTDLPVDEKRARLKEWHEEVRLAYLAKPRTALGAELAEIIRTYLIPPTPLEEIINGVEMDLSIDRYPDFKSLEQYCYRVASAVGLVSIEIFTYQNERSRAYAVALGMAFQLTNILRDVAKDASFGRIYLPRDEREAYGISDDDIFQGRWSPQMQQLLRFQALRARHYFAKSWRLLPPADRPNMLAAEIMREVYQGVLDKIERLEFNVFGGETRLTKLQKARLVLRARRREKKQRPTPPPPKRVLVLGGGFAGLAAATELVLRGHQVTVLESRRLLGGRAHSFRDAKTGQTVDNGQHILMGCYHETLALLRQLGCAGRLLVPNRLDIPFYSERGASRLRTGLLPAPLHLVSGLLGFSELSWSDRRAAAALSTSLRLGRQPGPDETAAQWLDRHAQPANLRRALWEPLCLAALNEPLESAAATLFATVISRALLGSKADSAIVISRVGLSDLFAPEVENLLKLCQCDLRRSAVVTRLDFSKSRLVAVQASDGESPAFDHVISALPWNALRGLLPVDSSLAEACRQIGDSPIVSLHLWLDRPILKAPFAGFLDSLLHWVFNHDAIAAPAAPSHQYALVISGARELAEMPSEQIEALGLRELRRFLPAARQAEVRHRVIYKSRSATFATTPDAEKLRPGPATPWENFWLAGDWTDTGLPATLEGAVLSGRRAAALVDAAPAEG